MGSLSIMIKPASGMCNMYCDYCFYRDETKKRGKELYGFMTDDTLKNIIRRTMLRAEGAISYVFQGGEPTLCGVEFFEKVVGFQKQYNRRGIVVSNALQTNGYGLDEEWCRFLRDNRFLVGLSVDGIKETHDACRRSKTGDSTYEHVVRAAKLMDEWKVDYNIITVVNKMVAGNIDKIYESYRRMGWKYQQYIACLEPLGEPHGKRGYAVTTREYGEFLIKLFELWYQDWKKGRQPYIRQFENYIGILMGYQPEACDMNGTCGVQYVVEADGSVYPCDFYVLDEWKLGNFNENRLDELELVCQEKGFIERSTRLTEDCRACPYFSICRGGCQRNRDLVGKGGVYHNYFCRSFKMFFEQCLPQLLEIRGA